jgi:hypothetical protein
MSRSHAAARGWVAFAGLLVLSACSSAHDSANAGGGPLIRWTAAVPTQLRTVPVATVPPCRASQLAVVGPGLQLTPAGPGGAGTITLRNTGGRACRLTGRPGVRIVGAPYAVAQHQQRLPTVAPTFPDIRPPANTLLALRPQQTAALGIEWSNWCPPRPRTPGTPQAAPRSVRVTLPANGGAIGVDYDAVPDCTTPGQPSTIGVRPFAPSPLPATRPWTSARVTATIVPLGGALSGKRGQRARYGVRLHNGSGTTVPFQPCPILIQVLEPAGTPEAHELNCAAAGPLRPGADVTFEMRIPVPAGAPLGKNGLFWELDPTGAQGPEAVSSLRVTRG